MRFLLFSDLHHMTEYFMKGSLDDLLTIQKRAANENVEFIIHAGDLTHGPSEDPDFVRTYNEFSIPSYHCLGNHDSDHTDYEETLKYYNMPDGHYYFDHGGYRFIVADPNYYFADGKYTHYSLGNYYKYGPYRDYMPPEQLEWLRETISSAPHPCIIISHESFEREANGVKNQEDVRDIINAANRVRPHSVLMCINGHHHRDFIRILDGVCYMEINSASYDYLPQAHDLYPEEICKKYRYAPHTIMYNDPLSAIITLEGTTIDIRGMESSLYMGISREMTGNPKLDPAGRAVYPRIQTTHITL